MKALLTACAVALFVVAGATKADELFFLDAGTQIKGDSTAQGYENMIQVLSFNLGVKNSVTIGVGAGGGAGIGKASFQPIVVYKYTDIASPLLFLACTNGKAIPTVVLHAVKFVPNSEVPNYREYLTITLTKVIVSGINDNGPDQNNASQVAESVSLVCATMKMTVKTFGSDGRVTKTVTDGWDFITNRQLPGSTAPPP